MAVVSKRNIQARKGANHLLEILLIVNIVTVTSLETFRINTSDLTVHKLNNNEVVQVKLTGNLDRYPWQSEYWNDLILQLHVKMIGGWGRGYFHCLDSTNLPTKEYAVHDGDEWATIPIRRPWINRHVDLKLIRLDGGMQIYRFNLGDSTSSRELDLYRKGFKIGKLISNPPSSDISDLVLQVKLERPHPNGMQYDYAVFQLLGEPDSRVTVAADQLQTIPIKNSIYDGKSSIAILLDVKKDQNTPDSAGRKLK